jgi:SAM-dependent methyltransferase
MTAAETTSLDGQTWHHGLVARWWSNRAADPDELAYFGDAIRKYGEPALDLGCGTGRILIPLLAQGLDVDGVDLSEDMLGWCRQRAATDGVEPQLWAQGMRDLDLPRRYRTIFICDSFGIGGSRKDDREALHRIFNHLEPGGALVIHTEFPYDDGVAWPLWLPHQRGGLPRDWPEAGSRQTLPDGEELEQRGRLVDLDPRAQRMVLGISARHWRGGTILAEEEREMAISLYFEQELLQMFEEAGFAGIEVQAGYTGKPATADDTEIVWVGTRAA